MNKTLWLCFVSLFVLTAAVALFSGCASDDCSKCDKHSTAGQAK